MYANWCAQTHIYSYMGAPGMNIASFALCFFLPTNEKARIIYIYYVNFSYFMNLPVQHCMLYMQLTLISCQLNIIYILVLCTHLIIYRIIIIVLIHGSLDFNKNGYGGLCIAACECPCSTDVDHHCHS